MATYVHRFTEPVGLRSNPEKRHEKYSGEARAAYDLLFGLLPEKQGLKQRFSWAVDPFNENSFCGSFYSIPDKPHQSRENAVLMADYTSEEAKVTITSTRSTEEQMADALSIPSSSTPR